MLPVVAVAQSRPIELRSFTFMPASVSALNIQQSQESLMPVSTAAASADTCWTVAEGDWKYYSSFTDKTYPTVVKYKYVNETVAHLQLTNELGTYHLQTSLITGNTTSLFETDENGNSIYPNLGGMDMTMSTGFGNTKSCIYGSWAAYPLSGYARLATNYYRLVNGVPDKSAYLNFGYDYLYNTQAKSCKIKADYAKGYYKGEKTAKVSLQCGEGVTDVYYVMGQKIIDEKRSQADSLWSSKSIGTIVERKYIKEYVAEYKAGETNDAYIVGHVDKNATEFQMPLPDRDGITHMFIVAYSGDQITDMVFDMIEVQRPTAWKNYGYVDIDHQMIWGMGSNNSDNIIESGTYPIQVNSDTTRLRIEHPFATNQNPDANYLYINAENGLANCYIESSYAPVEHTYEITAPDHTVSNIVRPYLMQDFASLNLYRGFKPDSLLSLQVTFDLSSGYCPENHVFARDYNWQIYSDYMNDPIYVGGCFYGPMSFKLNNAVAATPDIKGISFTVGTDVDYLICSFGYGDTLATKSVSAYAGNRTFRVKAESGQAVIDIHSLLKNNEIPQAPTYIYYTAYDAMDNRLRGGQLDISEHEFDKEVCNLVYDENPYHTNAELAITRKDDVNSGVSTFTVEKFGSTLKFADPNTNISFDIDSNGLKTQGMSFYINELSAGGSLYDAYANIGNLTLVKDMDRYCLSGTIDWLGCVPGTTEVVGYFTSTNFTLTIPNELSYDLSSIEIPTMDNDTYENPVYYNLQGIRIDNPLRGMLLIEKKGNTTRKIVFE